MTSNKPTKQKREIVRIVEYLVSGGAYFWSGYLMFFALDKGLGLSLWWAKLLANITGWTVNYVLQRYWVFNNPNLKKQNKKTSERYFYYGQDRFVCESTCLMSSKKLLRMEAKSCLKRTGLYFSHKKRHSPMMRSIR